MFGHAAKPYRAAAFTRSSAACKSAIGPGRACFTKSEMCDRLSTTFRPVRVCWLPDTIAAATPQPTGLDDAGGRLGVENDRLVRPPDQSARGISAHLYAREEARAVSARGQTYRPTVQRPLSALLGRSSGSVSMSGTGRKRNDRFRDGDRGKLLFAAHRSGRSIPPLHAH